MPGEGVRGACGAGLAVHCNATGCDTLRATPGFQNGKGVGDGPQHRCGCQLELGPQPCVPRCLGSAQAACTACHHSCCSLCLPPCPLQHHPGRRPLHHRRHLLGGGAGQPPAAGVARRGRRRNGDHGAPAGSLPFRRARALRAPARVPASWRQPGTPPRRAAPLLSALVPHAAAAAGADPVPSLCRTAVLLCGTRWPTC